MAETESSPFQKMVPWEEFSGISYIYSSAIWGLKSGRQTGVSSSFIFMQDSYRISQAQTKTQYMEWNGESSLSCWKRRFFFDVIFHPQDLAPSGFGTRISLMMLWAGLYWSHQNQQWDLSFVTHSQLPSPSPFFFHSVLRTCFKNGKMLCSNVGYNDY